MLLAHPEAEDLGRFVEGTLDESERAAVVDHIADCDDCRILVVDAAEFESQSAVETQKWGVARWLAIAASIVIVAGSSFLWYVSRDPLTPVIKASAGLSNRPIEPRLSRFRYVARNTMRGGDEDETEVSVLLLDQAIAKVLERRGDAPRILHARGVAYLLSAATAKQSDRTNTEWERREAAAALIAAASREPANASYQNDLAAALIVSGDAKKRRLALVYLNRALLINPRSPEALFNRAITLRDLDRKAAIAAFKTYLTVDSSSPWAKEAKRNLDDLQDGL
jgi:tetratricopeptide (TPR) repeat protein